MEKNPKIMNQPKIVFCTTCKGRTKHLIETLPKNLEDNNDYENLKFVVLGYGEKLPFFSLNYYFREFIEAGRLVIYENFEAENFKMAHAKNMAHRCGMLEGADILVNLDADGFTGPGFASYIAEKFQEPNIFLQAMWNRWVERDGTEEWLSAGADGNLVPPVPKGSNGRMAVTTNAFLKAGGYNEKFETWGPDDKDFNIRLRRLGYEPRLIERQFLNTILHNDKVRFAEYPDVKSTKGYDFAISVNDSCEAIANFGKIGCGTVLRNFDSKAIELAPLPTRIFGIGMHKTGTTSLHHALIQLGFDSAHWTNAHWAKAIWREMNNLGMSPTLEKSYALSDLPIPLLYQKLDKAYPGSKFILTVRSSENWLRSVERHWSNANRYHNNWVNDPFSNRIHKILYKQTDFNAKVFLNRYRKHVQDVIAYFDNRPNDLHVMYLDWPNFSDYRGFSDAFREEQWFGLPTFLSKPVPAEPYPRKYVSEEIDFQI